MVYLWPKPMSCTACGHTWNTLAPGYDPNEVDFGMLLVSVACGHLMALAPGYVMVDLSRDQAADVAAHPNFPRIRAMQQQVTARMIG